MLVKALADLNYKVAENATVRGYQGNTLKSEVVVQPGGKYDVGFDRTKEGAYQVVADWWGVQQDLGLSTKAFMDPVTQRYAYHKVVAEVAKQGFQVVTEQTAADQTLKVTVRRWG